ncbi:hypothetical protein Glove_330g15 [Diversispora epigaea]|uniref:Uncharacterized protein n=1 Tax=Diversispora epigaea TaxID=1348612 RepID=A0A397HK27_9GLOM|nr:hypothetical protein Glove_330g15 [Diversispora epigaea]
MLNLRKKFKSRVFKIFKLFKKQKDVTVKYNTSKLYYTQTTKDNLFTTTQNIQHIMIQNTNVIQENMVQSISIKFKITACKLELSDQEQPTKILVSTNNQSKINNIKNTLIQDWKIFQDTMIQNTSTINDQNIIIISTLDTLYLNTPITTSTISETVESLRAYEKKSDDAQKFLDYMGNNFKWPASMSNLTKILIFRAFIDIDDNIFENYQEYIDNNIFEDDQEYMFNYIYLCNNFDQNIFNEYEKDWILTYKPKVKNYELEKYTN